MSDGRWISPEQPRYRPLIRIGTLDAVETNELLKRRTGDGKIIHWCMLARGAR